MTSAKSLFHRIFRITPTRSRICAEIVRNSLKTRIRAGGGEGRTTRVSSSLARSLGAPSFPGIWERVGLSNPGETDGWPPLSTIHYPLSTLFLALLITTLTISALSQEAITDPAKLESKTVADMQAFSIEKLYMTRQIGGSAWSPDGKQIAFISNISGRNNLWLVPAAGGWPTQLTISEQRQGQPAWSPDGNWIAYISDHDGDEQWDIFLVSPQKRRGREHDASRPKPPNGIPAWSPDGKQLAYVE